MPEDFERRYGEGVTAANELRWKLETQLEAQRHQTDRINKLETALAEIPVLKERVQNLGDDVRGLKRAFYTFSFSMVISAFGFAFTVFELLGK